MGLVRLCPSCLVPPFSRSISSRSTIYALSTPPGRAGVALIRVSGPAARHVFASLVHSTKSSKPLSPRHSRLTPCIVVDTRADHRRVIDQGMAVFFQGPKSFTTEDCVELHIHSSPPVISRILDRLSHVDGCRPALPGEFTQRAFEHGRIDLIQAEGLADLINAETEEQRALALNIAQGTNSILLEKLRSRIINCLANMEALLDFGEGEDLESGLFDGARKQAAELRLDIERYLHDGRIGEIIRSGIRATIFGPPNAGKSTLLNFFARRDAAIVTPLPGTTRDVIEVSADIAGMPVIFADTAGLRRTDDYVESIGIERATNAVLNNDLSLCVLSLPDLTTKSQSYHIDERVSRLIDTNTLIICNKLDLVSSAALAGARAWIHQHTGCGNIHFVSLAKGLGMDGFIDEFANLIQTRFQMHGQDVPLITRQRHRTHLEKASSHLNEFGVFDLSQAVLAAEELRLAAKEIGLITGHIGVEEILDSIFRSFCIGK